jgi:catechol 2,3-dioxygenase-like lactoylglutathione lyase family enzyme
MSVLAVEDIAYVRFTAPRLSEMQAFLSDFGLFETFSADGILYMRGAGRSPYVHVTEQGRPGFAGLALRARDMADLERLAATQKQAIEPLNAPGGGAVVRLRDPDGFCVEVVAGQSAVEPLLVEPIVPWNSAASTHRVRQTKRLRIGPSHVVRLGHCVLAVRDFRAAERWYKEMFGFITSDEIVTAEGLVLGAFLRCDRGDTATDHHTLALALSAQAPRLEHAAFEVRDLDDLMVGHDYLASRGHAASWGVGRHVLGSQVFDYWRDPWGHTLEHWTDGDLLTRADGSRQASIEELRAVQWGAPGSASA